MSRSFKLRCLACLSSLVLFTLFASAAPNHDEFPRRLPPLHHHEVDLPDVENPAYELLGAFDLAQPNLFSRDVAVMAANNTGGQTSSTGSSASSSGDYTCGPSKPCGNGGR